MLYFDFLDEDDDERSIGITQRADYRIRSRGTR